MLSDLLDGSMLQMEKDSCFNWIMSLRHHKPYIQEAIRIAMQSSANLRGILANMLITSRIFGTIKEG
ncbi:Uncharacterized protein APZ42_024379 [Daphnia magna]|uniref:Uncharacterized protein n=1 Tax=Daphnia magna TaxID=35525 RepID=A0A0P5KS01_9CRUS|nr:Uncharacterized protein APZ42_024379 [Daphnia magna]